jgi:hypothetical protein
MPQEIRTEETAVYDCDLCGKEMRSRLPKGLRGRFIHTECEFPEDRILDAPLITEPYSARVEFLTAQVKHTRENSGGLCADKTCTYCTDRYQDWVDEREQEIAMERL